MNDFITVNKKKGTGSGNVSVTVGENPTNEERTGSFIVQKTIGGRRAVVTVKQAAGHVVLIPEFDYLVLRYGWAATSGSDFDTATGFVDTGLSDVDGKLVGWSRQYQYTQERVGDYLIHGGDNMSSGQESALINMGTLLAGGNFTRLPELIHLDIYGNWYLRKGDGKVTVSFTAYKGGTMSKDGFNFINTGGQEVYTGSETTTVTASGENNFEHIRQLYTKIATMEYNKTERTCVIYLNR